MSHTPGKWITEERTHAEQTGSLLSIYVAQEYDHPKQGKVPGGRICEVFSNCLADDKACEANARLIAAAPDLLAALKWIMERVDAQLNVNAGCRQKARAAIARAEGK